MSEDMLDPGWKATKAGHTPAGQRVYDSPGFGRFVIRHWESGMVGRESYGGPLRNEAPSNPEPSEGPAISFNPSAALQRLTEPEPPAPKAALGARTSKEKA